MFSQNLDAEIDSSYKFLRDNFYLSKSSDSIKAKFYAKEFIKKARDEENISKLITGYYLVSDINGDWQPYLELLDSLLFVAKKNPSTIHPAFIYQQKGNLYIKYANYDESLKQYLLALNSSNIYRNDSIKYILKQNIAVLKGINKEYEEEKQLFLEAYHFYEKNNKIDNNHRFSLVLNLSNSYNNLKKYDSATFYNNRAYELAVTMKDDDFKSYSLYLKGRIEYSLHNYDSCISNLEEAMPNLYNDENYRAISNSYRLIIKSYSKLNNKEKMIEYCLKAESFYTNTNFTHKSQRYILSILTNYYKEKNNLNGQLEYLLKLLKVDSTLNARAKNLDKTFFEEYDKPKLIEEKERVLQKLKDNKVASNKTKLLLGSVAIFAIAITGFQYNKRRVLKKRFNSLQESFEDKLEETQETKNVLEELSLSKEISTYILEQLEKFEKNTGFTDISITLNSLAKTLNTNANYLSRTVNHFKNKGFSAYLSELRINYALELLQVNPTVRKYTIKAIANEVGFKNAESFSKAFYKKTGLKPSYYVKQLEELNKFS